MAIYRTIQLSFWTDSKVVDDFTPEDRYFYLYLMTNPHTNLCGCYEISIRQIASEIGYSKDVVERLIDRMEKTHNVVRYDRNTKELLILNWHKYNWTTSPKLRPAIVSNIEKVKTPEFAEYLVNTLNGIDTVSIPYEYRSDTSVTVTDTVTDIVSVSDTDKEDDIYSTVRHRYGEYGHVLLTQKQRDKLTEDYGEEATKAAIKKVDEYCQEHGKSYKDYNLTLRKWGFDKPKRKEAFVNTDEWLARKEREQNERK